jgi:hypothetical protein
MGITREQAVSAAVESLTMQIDAMTLHAILSAGEEEFIRVARREWTGHGFQSDDFRAAFRQLSVIASRYQQTTPRVM